MLAQLNDESSNEVGTVDNNVDSNPGQEGIYGGVYYPGENGMASADSVYSVEEAKAMGYEVSYSYRLQYWWRDDR